MCASLRVFENNNLERVNLVPCPNTGRHAPSIIRAKTLIRYHVGEELRLSSLEQMCLSEIRLGRRKLEKQAASLRLNGEDSAAPVRLAHYKTRSEAFPAADAALAAFARAGGFFSTADTTFIAAIMKISCRVKPRVVMYHICASHKLRIGILQASCQTVGRCK